MYRVLAYILYQSSIENVQTLLTHPALKTNKLLVEQKFLGLKFDKIFITKYLLFITVRKIRMKNYEQKRLIYILIFGPVLAEAIISLS